MIRGLYTAAAGLATVTLRMGVISNNIANASTAGYKQDVVPEDAGEPLDLERMSTGTDGEAIGTLTLGPKSGLSQLDLSAGPLQQTGQPLDLSLSGPGFFAVQDASGQTSFTRDGGFTLDGSGALRSRDGSAVLDANGQPIHLPTSNVTIGENGTIQANGATVAQLGVYEFPASATLKKLGQGLLVADDGSTPTKATATRVEQGSLEGSNVDLGQAMVSMMELSRAYESNQRLLQMQDTSLGLSVNDVGKV